MSLFASRFLSAGKCQLFSSADCQGRVSLFPLWPSPLSLSATLQPTTVMSSVLSAAQLCRANINLNLKGETHVTESEIFGAYSHR